MLARLGLCIVKSPVIGQPELLHQACNILMRLCMLNGSDSNFQNWFQSWMPISVADLLAYL